MPNEDSDLERAKKLVPQQIRDTFHRIAKTAMDGSAEADDPTLNLLDKAHKAYGRVTLIVDDAMRGLRELNDRMLWIAMQAGLEKGAEREGIDPSSPH